MGQKRRILIAIIRGLLRLSSHWEVHGRENVPDGGPLLVVFNHIAHFDGPLVIASACGYALRCARARAPTLRQ